MPRELHPENLRPCKPGETNNPNGRPKGKRNILTVLRELLEGMANNEDFGNPVATKYIQIAFGKNPDTKKDYPPEVVLKALNEIRNMLGEQPPSKQEITGADGQPIEANINVILGGKISTDE